MDLKRRVSFVVVSTLLLLNTSLLASVPRVAFSPSPKKVLIAPVKGNFVCVTDTISLAGFLAGGVPAALIKKAATSGARTSLAEVLLAKYPDFRPERAVAEELQNYLRQSSAFAGSQITCLDDGLESDAKQELRDNARTPFQASSSGVASWILAGQRWAKRLPSSSYLPMPQRENRELVCVEFLLTVVVVNHANTAEITGVLRLVDPNAGTIIGQSVRETVSCKIASLEKAEGLEIFVAEFRKAAAMFAKVTMDKAIK